MNHIIQQGLPTRLYCQAFEAFAKRTDQKDVAVEAIATRYPGFKSRGGGEPQRLRAGWALLDVGCGSGDITLSLLEILDHCAEGPLTVIFLDPSRPLLDVAREEAARRGLDERHNLFFVNDTAENFIEKPGVWAAHMFDLVLLSHSLYYLRGGLSLALQMRKRVRRGGKLLIIQYARESDSRRVREIYLEACRSLSALALSGEEVEVSLRQRGLGFVRDVVRSRVEFDFDEDMLKYGHRSVTSVGKKKTPAVLLTEFFVRQEWDKIPDIARQRIYNLYRTRKRKNRVALSLVDLFIWIDA